MVIAWGRLGIPVNLVTVGGYLGFMLISVLVSCSLFLLPNLLSLWLMNTSSIAEITDSFWDFNSLPMGIYPRWVSYLGVFVVTIFVISNFPPMFLLNKLPPFYLAWSVVVPVILLLLVRSLWAKGLESYSSASS